MLFQEILCNFLESVNNIFFWLFYFTCIQSGDIMINMIEGDDVVYEIHKMEDRDYDVYDVLVNKKVEYQYYEKSLNRFASRVYIFAFYHDFPSSYFLENSIYFFCDDLKRVGGFIEILNQEFYNLEYYFVVQEEYYEIVRKFVSDLKIKVSILKLQEYFDRNKSVDRKGVYNQQYAHYDLKDNPFLQNELEEKNKNDSVVSKDFADYNGFNERFIDNNVKNIVQVKKSGGDKNEL